MVGTEEPTALCVEVGEGERGALAQPEAVAYRGGEGVAASGGEGEGASEGVPETLWHVEGELVGAALLLRDGIGGGEGELVLQALPPPVSEVTALSEKAGVAEADLDGDSLGCGVALRWALGVSEGVALALGLGDAKELSEAEGVLELLAAGEGDSVAEGKPLADARAVADFTDGDGDSEAVCAVDKDPEVLPLALSDADVTGDAD